MKKEEKAEKKRIKKEEKAEKKRLKKEAKENEDWDNLPPPSSAVKTVIGTLLFLIGLCGCGFAYYYPIQVGKDIANRIVDDAVISGPDDPDYDAWLKEGVE